jgi:hypothetical protein
MVFFIGVSSFSSYHDIEGNANLRSSRKHVFRIIKTAVPGEPRRFEFFKKMF